jgi:hypothetical protein
VYSSTEPSTNVSSIVTSEEKNSYSPPLKTSGRGDIDWRILGGRDSGGPIKKATEFQHPTTERRDKKK